MPTVIKAGESGPVLRRLATVDLADHLAEAHGVVAQACRDAQQIESQARYEAGRVAADAQSAGHKTGYSKGYEKGLAEGRKAGEAAAYAETVDRLIRENADVAADLLRAVQEIQSVKADLRITAEKDLLSFAIEVARKLTFAVGIAHRDSAVENLRRVLRMVEENSTLTIRVHSRDLEAMKTFAPTVLAEMGRFDSVQVCEDDSVAPGGCVVQNRATRIDATLDTQIEELIAALMGEGASHV